MKPCNRSAKPPVLELQRLEGSVTVKRNSTRVQDDDGVSKSIAQKNAAPFPCCSNSHPTVLTADAASYCALMSGARVVSRDCTSAATGHHGHSS